MSAILQRKEAERRANDGVFLWGIGSSVRPSLLELLRLTSRPTAVFSPMASRPRPIDVAPRAVVVWRSAVDLDGLPFVLPRYSIVTSRKWTREGQTRHYALVCRRERPIGRSEDLAWLDSGCVRNLRGGTNVGASQVTSVVTRGAPEEAGSVRYDVAFTARLVAPYFVELKDPVDVPKSLRLDDPTADRVGLVRDLGMLVRHQGSVLTSRRGPHDQLRFVLG